MDMTTPLHPVQIPITGREPIDDPTRPEQALAQFYRALNDRDLELMAQNWDDSWQIAMDNPLGGIKRGWPEIRPVYERLFNVKGTYWFEFYDYTLHQCGDVFYAVGRERGRLAPVNRAELDLAIRTTRIFRRVADGRWRQVHHHGSIESPDLLDAYQKAVL